MEKIPNFSYYDNELQYSQALESWIVQLTERLAKLSRDYPHPHLIVTSSINNEHEVMDRMKQHNKSLKQVVETLYFLISEMAERRKRLADRAVGLTDGEVDKEGV